jgi:hypothetical protein
MTLVSDIAKGMPKPIASPMAAGKYHVEDPPAKSPGDARVVQRQKCSGSSTRLSGQGTLIWVDGVVAVGCKGLSGRRGCVAGLGEQPASWGPFPRPKSQRHLVVLAYPPVDRYLESSPCIRYLALPATTLREHEPLKVIPFRGVVPAFSVYSGGH